MPEGGSAVDRAALEAGLAELPILQYEWISTKELTFSDRVRHVCATECPMYGTTWACPPGVGSVETCVARCRSYPDAFSFFHKQLFLFFMYDL